MMKPAQWALVGGFVLVGAVLRAATPPLTSLVDENTALVISAGHLPDLVKNWEGSPWAKTWNDAGVMKFFGPLREQLDIDGWDEKTRAATGYALTDLTGFAQGQALLAIPHLDFLLDPDTKRPDVLLVIEFGAKTETVEKVMLGRLQKARLADTTEDFHGVTLHAFRPEGGNKNAEVHWATSDGLLLAAGSIELLEQTILNLRKGGADAPLTSAEGFVGAQRREPDAQVLFYANCQVIYPVILKMAEKERRGRQANPFMPAPAVLMRSLGLDAFGVISFGMNLGHDATTATLAISYTEERGLTKLLAQQQGDMPQPHFIPARWPVVSVGRFSIKSLYATLEEVLHNVSPPLDGLVQGQITAYNNQLGIDLKRDLFGSLGDEMITGYAPRENGGHSAGLDQMDRFFAVSVNNRQALEHAVEALKTQFGGPDMFAKRDYLGETIYTFGQAGADSPANFSYAITQRYLFVSIGSAGAVETAIQGLSGDHASFWDEPTVKAAIESMPPGADGLGYWDMKKLVVTIFQTLARLPLTMPESHPAAPEDGQDEADGSKGDDADQPPAKIVDASALPDAAALEKYWNYGVSAAYHEPSAIVCRYRLTHPH